MYTKFGLIEFKEKNRFSTFARLGDLSIFFKNELGEIDIDVKGLGNDQMLLHADYMLTFIGNLFYMIENSPLTSVIEYFTNFYNRYLRRELDIEFYRELNTDSLFVIRSPLGNDKFGLSQVNDISQIDITYNAGILRELYSIISELHQRNI